MSKPVFALFILLMLLAVSAVAQTQGTTSDEPFFILTEEQISREFSIPSSATRRISDLEVDVQENGVHLSFELTTTRNGTTTTTKIIAILIGLVQDTPQSSYTFDWVSITSVTAPGSLQRELETVVRRAWQNYVRSAMGGVDVSADHVEAISMLMAEDGIYFFVSEPPTTG
jgi:hypothetical protein